MCEVCVCFAGQAQMIVDMLKEMMKGTLGLVMGRIFS